MTPIVGIVHSPSHVVNTRHPKHCSRGVYVHSLIEGMSLIDSSIGPIEVVEDQGVIESYHEQEYLDGLREETGHLKRRKCDLYSDDESEDNKEPSQPKEVTYEDIAEMAPVRILSPRVSIGLTEDCPRFSGCWKYVMSVASGSISAAKSLRSGQYLRAIHFEGGRHHAQQDRASGFCYVADVVLAANELLRTFKKILIIDIDAHHGDGVESAFYRSKKVMTLSYHMHAPGVFPSSGDQFDTGRGQGTGYNMNIPLKPGCDDDVFHYAFKRIVSATYSAYQPEAIIMVCGADAVHGDPLGELRLSVPCLLQCISYVRDFGKPTLILGGGGYSETQTARYWTMLTHIMKKPPPPDNITSAFDPYDSSLPIQTTSEVRALGMAHIADLPTIIPPDNIPPRIYESFAPYTLLPDPPTKPSLTNGEHHIRHLVHTSLDLLLRTMPEST
eukprot:TRINITY_DN3449_c1_g1_i1.p1 TRINITY_DN3449_c1_g1~~TRINITY_DN3449_c1_g1_i1.p1  ORF type:complete len:443 (+),score=48.51 TRINITY_DN3449_c1_g1_i1:58-1386(+)